MSVSVVRIRVKRNIRNKQLRKRSLELLSDKTTALNITPNNDIQKYPTIGKDKRTFITDKKTFEKVLDKNKVNAIVNGRRGAETRRFSGIRNSVSKLPGLSRIVSNRAVKRRLLDIKARNGKLNMSERQARKLEKSLGLPKERLRSNNTISLVNNIDKRQPRIPKQGNKDFKGAYKGLPKKDPEVTIKGIPSNIKQAREQGIRQVELSIKPTKLDKIRNKTKAILNPKREASKRAVKRLQNRNEQANNLKSRYGSSRDVSRPQTNNKPRESKASGASQASRSEGSRRRR